MNMLVFRRACGALLVVSLVLVALAGCSEPSANGVTSDGGLDVPDVTNPPPDVRPDVQCAAGQTACGTRCSTLTDDSDNCGMCGTVCPRGQVCAAGVCRSTCPMGQTLCGERCVSTDTDRAHCGACGTVCPQGEVCAAGRCALECGAGLAQCGGDGDAGSAVRMCVNTRNDRLHCGACGNVCPAGQLCNDGTCSLTCVAGQVPCAGACRDLQRDSAHCGTCGNACAAGQICREGVCAVSCPPGQVVCAGACVDLQRDTANCGACGNACSVGAICAAGMCEVRCAPDQTRCGTECRNVQSDPAHCGMCGNMCASPAGARSFCAMGRCGFVCAAGVGDCDGDASNGCETDLSLSTSCGSCGVRCAFSNASSSCMMARCVMGTCNAGFLDCDMSPTNGCEIDGRTSNTHCGACGRACAAGEVCAMGRCERTCSMGLTACGDRCANLETDTSNCGACGTVCSTRANASAICALRACGFLCNTGFVDCDGIGTNGCEVDTRTDNNNCGACGRRCASGTCSGGTCTRYVFVTSTMHNGNLGGLDGADAICQMRANEAGLPGTYRAWLANASGSPATRFTRSTAPYVLVNGQVVANDWNDLVDGTIQRPIDRTERDMSAPLGNTSCAGGGPMHPTAWSGVASNGSYSGSEACGGWTSSTGSGLWGWIASTSQWSSWCSGGLCSWLSPLYCFQQ